MERTPDDDAGLIRTLGIELVTVSVDEVVAEMEVTSRHLRGHDRGEGPVHGAVHCVLIESATSIGAFEFSKSRGGGPPLALELNASYLRAVTKGRLRVRATPITRGQTTQVWEATVQDDEGRTVATGRLRFLNGPAGAAVSGPPGHK